MISPTLTGQLSAQAPNAAAVQTSSVLSSDFETFLKMLTTQAENQDPLEPIDSSEYAAQLAQFSMVEQQVLSNDLLTALTSQLSSGSMAQYANWIGMDARTTALVPLGSTPIDVFPTSPHAGADAMDLVVYDAFGAEVQRLAMSVGSDPVAWAGIAADGTPFNAGLYRFETESFSQGALLSASPAQTYARVTEARLEGGETILILDGGTSVPSSAVSGLRESL